MKKKNSDSQPLEIPIDAAFWEVSKIAKLYQKKSDEFVEEPSFRSLAEMIETAVCLHYTYRQFQRLAKPKK